MDANCNKASQLSLVLTAKLALWSLLAPKNKMATAKMLIQGFKTVHKPMGDVTDAMFIIYAVYVSFS